MNRRDAQPYDEHAPNEDAETRSRWLPRPLRELFNERLPKRVGWPQILGAMLVGLILLQALTGVLLALNYAPSTLTAWESIRYVQEQATWGWLIRGLHHWGATAAILVALAHLIRVFLYAAYRAPRRWTWVAGVLLLLTLLAFGLTGYLLPWDLKAYFGTKVATSIPGSLPVIGPALMKLIRGGQEIGSLTLTRFYAIHVIILPGALAVLIIGHLALVRRHGITPPWSDIGDKTERDRPFFPWQAWRDSAGILVAIIVVFTLTFSLGAPLEDKADPTNLSYVPRPDWYFLWLQQLLRIFHGPWQILATAIIPGVAVSLLLLLPWIDRNPHRRLSSRKIALGLGGACFVAVAGLTAAGHLALRREESAAAQRQIAEAPPTQPVLQLAPEPELATRGEEIYEALRCAVCHGPQREQVIPGLPPDLSYAGIRLQPLCMESYLKSPQPIRGLDDGRRPTLRMPDYRLTDDEARALAAHLAGQADPARFDQAVNANVMVAADGEEGRRLFQQYNCLGCHTLEGQGSRVGPDLSHVGSRLREPYLYIFLKDPEAIIPGTPMQSVDLWDEEAATVAKYLSTLK